MTHLSNYFYDDFLTIVYSVVMYDEEFQGKMHLCGAVDHDMARKQ